MSVLEDVNKLKASDIVIAIAVFLASLSPGFLTLYLFKPNLMAQMDTAKVIIFSAALGLPLLAINFLLMIIIDARRPVALPKTVLGSSIAAVLSFYIALLCVHIYKIHFNLFLLALALANAGVFLFAVPFNKWMNNRVRKAAGQQ